METLSIGIPLLSVTVIANVCWPDCNNDCEIIPNMIATANVTITNKLVLLEKVTYLCTVKETMAMGKRIIDIADVFKDKTTVTRDVLADYIRSIDRKASDDSIRQRISRWKRAGLIISVTKNMYVLSKKPVYEHSENNFIKNLGRLFSSQYPEINYCTWSSAWLYDFTIHQPTGFFYVFETEPDMVETAFNFLKDNGYKTFLNPDSQTMQLYVIGQKNPVVVKHLISRAPLVKKKFLSLPALEKLLADAFIEKKLFYFLQGEELKNIFRFSFERYNVNLSRLLNYACRRGLEKELKEFLIQTVPDVNKIISSD